MDSAVTDEVPPEDVVRITQIEHLYGHLLDGRRWDRLGEVFTDDAAFDLTGADLGAVTGKRYEGLAAIRALFADTQHALAHHASNVYVYRDGGDVRVASKFFGPAPGGMLSAQYDDVAVRTPAGWRLRERRVVSRTLTSDPAVAGTVLR